MTARVVPLLARRRAEAEVLGHVYAAVAAKFGADVATTVVTQAVEAAARQAGEAFAREASGGPSLEHFASVVEIWRGQDSLEVRDLTRDGGELSFEVTRCRYAELYATLGLPGPLRTILSCHRDASFAAGYSPALRLQRSPTLAEGSPGCRFRFTWTADPT
jgi:hypothetical protein